MAFPTSITDIVATSIETRNKDIADNVSNSNAVLAYINKSGNIAPIKGGSSIIEQLSFAENGNASWYSGYDTLNTSASDVVGAATFSMKQLAAPVTISGLEELENSGPEGLLDLLEARITVAENTLKNRVVQGIYSDGTGFGGKQLTGLQAAVPLANNSGTYGGIDRSVYTFWQNQKFKCGTDGSGVATATTIGGYMNTLWAKCSRGMDKPNLIVMDNLYWALYMGSLQAIQRFSSPEVGALGFTSLKFMTADVIFDNAATNIPASTAYFLNTDYLRFRPHADRNFVALDPKKRFSMNQDAEVSILAWAGNMTCRGAQFQGVMQN